MTKLFLVAILVEFKKGYLTGKLIPDFVIKKQVTFTFHYVLY